MVALTMACGGGDDSGLAADDGGVAVATVDTANRATTTTTAPPTPTLTAAELGTVLSGFAFPIEGACLPQGDQLMPNAAREYRQGTHEGIDLYGVDNCVAIGLGTEVLAAKAGTVIRADHVYTELTQQTLNAILANPTTPESFDAFRGRQVWIDHGNGIVTRYCHLSGIVEELQVGDQVAQGEVIAFVGESGTPNSVTAPGSEYHLHWELRVGDSYLGAGQDPTSVRNQYLSVFGQ